MHVNPKFYTKGPPPPNIDIALFTLKLKKTCCSCIATRFVPYHIGYIDAE
jgi:hypothetical protein